MGNNVSCNNNDNNKPYLSIVVCLFGEFNNTAFPHDLTTRPGLAIVCEKKRASSGPNLKLISVPNMNKCNWV
jgi:hypothetical protein